MKEISAEEYIRKFTSRPYNELKFNQLHFCYFFSKIDPHIIVNICSENKIEYNRIVGREKYFRIEKDKVELFLTKLTLYQMLK